MASTYENDLRLEEMATGENSGSWGTKTNTNLELIADAFSYGTETIANADTTITIADGAADAARSLALKINSSEDLTTTRVVTLAPNTTSKVWIIENNTSGGQTLTISAGSGSNITLLNGQTKIIATDGIGAGSNVVELTQDIAIADMSVDGILSLADGSNSAPSLTNTGDTNTGLYFPAADEVGITTGGTQRVKVDSTGVDITGTLVSDGLTVDGTATFTTSDNNPQLIIKSTDADANDGPVFDLVRDSASPADNDFIGSIRFRADDSAGNETQYADIRVITNDVTDGTEDGQFNLRTMLGGSLRLRLKVDPTETVFNEESQNLDFRVESDSNTHMLFVDAGNDRVAIGTSTTTEMFNVGGSMELRSTSINLDFMETGVTDANFRLRQNTGNFFLQKLTDDKATSTEYYRADGGAGNVFNDNSVDIDFRVESDGATHALFVNAGSNRIIFGGTDTVNGADVEFLLGSGVSETPYVSIRNNATGTLTTDASARLDVGTWTNNGAYPNASNSYTGKLLFMAQATDNAYGAGGIESYLKTAGSRTRANTDSQLRFSVKDQTSTSAVEYFRLSGDEKSVVFNQLSADQDFRVESDSNANMLFVDAGASTATFGSNTAYGVLGIQQGASAGIPATTLGLNHVHANNKYIDFKWYDGSLMNIAQEGGSNIGINWSNTLAFNSSESGSSDFRIASDTISHLFAIDASENRVSIGGTNFGEGSGYIFNVRGGTSRFANPAADATVRIEGGSYTDPHRARLTLTGGYGDTGRTRFWHIDGQSHGGGGNVYNDLRFGYEVSNSATLYEVMRFNNEGHVIVNENGASNVDFRVESDSETHALFVDASTDRVGIKNSSPSYDLDIGTTATQSIGFGWMQMRTFTAEIPSSGTRWYKIANYTTGSMLEGQLFMMSARNGGADQTNGARMQHGSLSGYNNTVNSGDWGDVGTNYGHTGYFIEVGTDTHVYLQVNGSIYGGQVYGMFQGRANWTFDGSYVTSAP